MSESSLRQSPLVAPDESFPFPPRFYWLKRLSLFGLLLAVIVGGLRLWWGHEAQRRINVMIDGAHARGEPILPEDFQPRDIPAAENAAILYQQAENSIRFTQAERDFDPASPYSAADLQFVATMVTAHAAELKLLRVARDRHDADWGFRWTRPLYGGVWSRHLNAGRQLALLVRYVTAYDHGRGEDGNAAEDARDLLALGNAYSSAQPTFVGILVAEGLESIGVSAIVDMTPTLAISRPGMEAKNAATEEQVRSLIGDLLDESRFRQSTTQAWMGERMLAISGISEVVQSEIRPALAGNVLWPMFQLQSLRTARSYEAMIGALRQDNFPAAVAVMTPVEDSDRDSFLSTFVRTDLIAGAHVERLAELNYELRANRRLAAIMLAIRLYETDHDGRLPETLAELTPAYLPDVPLDPFSPENHALRYLPHREPPVVYSVGLDGVDQGGSPKPNGTSFPPPWDQEDAVYQLRPASATAESSAK